MYSLFEEIGIDMPFISGNSTHGSRRFGHLSMERLVFNTEDPHTGEVSMQISSYFSISDP